MPSSPSPRSLARLLRKMRVDALRGGWVGVTEIVIWDLFHIKWKTRGHVCKSLL